jgi:hypothetical protein
MAPRKVVTPENLSKDFYIDLGDPSGPVKLNLSTLQFMRDPTTGLITISLSALTGGNNTINDDFYVKSADGTAAAAPNIHIQRNSASPAASDLIGQLIFEGRDSTDQLIPYARVYGWIVDPVNGSEDGGYGVKTMRAGSEVDAFKVSELGHFGIGTGDPNAFATNYRRLVVGTELPVNGGISIVGTTQAGLLLTNGAAGATRQGGLTFNMGLGQMALGADIANPMVYTFDAYSAYNGRVGIGNPTPAYALDVTGDINASTGLRIAGVPISSGPRYWGRMAADYVLTSTTAVQKLFNFGPTLSGALTLPVGQYSMTLSASLDNMSIVTGNLTFTLAGTATIAEVCFQSIGRDVGSVDALGGGVAMGLLDNTGASQVITGASGAELQLLIEATFKVTAAGTIIPSVALTTAASAHCRANSSIIVQYLGDNSAQFSNGWA